MAELDIEALDCASSPRSQPLVKMAATRGATIRGCRPQAPSGVFLKLGNDLRQAAQWLEAEPEAARQAVALAGNLTS